MMNEYERMSEQMGPAIGRPPHASLSNYFRPWPTTALVLHEMRPSQHVLPLFRWFSWFLCGRFSWSRLIGCSSCFGRRKSICWSPRLFAASPQPPLPGFSPSSIPSLQSCPFDLSWPHLVKIAFFTISFFLSRAHTSSLVSCVSETWNAKCLHELHVFFVACTRLHVANSVGPSFI